MSDEEPQLPNLPQDIMVDILSRLPAKSLLKFRCVCKSWNSLIRNQKFTDFHLKRTKTNPSQQRILLSVKPFWSIEYDDLDDFGRDECDAIIKKDTPSSLGCLGYNIDFDLVGHCNGLICIVLRKGRSVFFSMKPIERTFCLWNPRTEESWEISSDFVADETMCASMFRDENCHRFELFGFGYDSTIDDYKIVILVSYGSHYDAVHVEVFTVGKRTWKKKKIYKDNVVTLYFGDKTRDCLFVNGAFHWITVSNYGIENVILSFNLEQEQLQIITLYQDVIRSLHDTIDPRVIDGKLALVTNPGD